MRWLLGVPGFKWLAHSLIDATTRAPVSSQDELGQLARDMNELAKALARTEQTRRQWVADISHELRTPLSVLRGELAALKSAIANQMGY